MATLPEIRFASIRAHLGSQTKGFEEMVVQIFNLDTQHQGEFRRVEGAGGDGGVEAYLIRPDGTEVAVQSKFFDEVKKGQWAQLDKSVHAAVKNHPKLTEYRIAVPIDLNPHQIKIWNKRVVAWNRHATSCGISRPIQFVWQGTTLLIAELLKPACAQAFTYWFGVPQFTDEWMNRSFKVALATLDKRYSPAEHVNTEAGRELQAFAHLPTIGNRLKRHFIHVVNAWQDLHAGISKSTTFSFNRSHLEKLTKAVDVFRSMPWSERSLPSFQLAGLATKAIRDIWRPIHEEIEKENEKARQPNTGSSPYHQAGPHDYLIRLSETFFRQLSNWDEFTGRYRCAEATKVLLFGEAGNGKSHVFAAIVDEARKRSQPALLLLGEQFSEQTPLATQVANNADWSSKPEELLSALNQSAIAFGAPALLFIDAINETTVQNLWFSKIFALVAKLEEYPQVRLALSCRTDFLPISLPEGVAKFRDQSWSYLEHEGLGESVFSAVQKYFERFRVKTLHFPPPLPEFGNPLFLRTFCETFEDSQIPEGPLSFTDVMKKRVDRLASKLSHDLDCPVDNTREAILALARAIQNNGGKSLPRKEAQKLVANYSPSQQQTKSLYYHLKSNSIIVETIRRPFESGDSNEVNVRFAFERFADYSIAADFLKTIPSVEQLKTELLPDGRLAWLCQIETYYKNRGVARALAIAVAEHFNIELIDLLPKINFENYLLEDFLQSFVWRSPASFSSASRRIFGRASEILPDKAFDTLLLTATIPGHPYNALYLHQQLVGMTLPDRETHWTIPVTGYSKAYHSRTNNILRWAFAVPLELASDEQARLSGYLFFWFLGSNFRGLRHQATVAAIRLLQGRSIIVAELLAAFKDVNDPYIQERMYAVASGVAMRERNPEALKALARTVYQQVFEPQYVTPHILLRDYARAVLDVAEHKDCLPAGVTKNDFDLPLRSKWPKIMEDDEFMKLVATHDWGRIIHSTQPNTKLGMYGDFGRYTMQHAVQLFSTILLTERPNAANRESYFDADLAQRWILQRAIKLGWTAARYKSYDDDRYSGRGGSAERFKIERIGKKYQWIALHELLGLISDRFRMSIRWKSDPRPVFAGAWQASSRDFDPSDALVDLDEGDDDDDETQEEEKSVAGYPVQFADITLNADREAWVIKPPDEFHGIIQAPRLPLEPETEWLVLWGYYEWKETEFQSLQLFQQGQLKMWAHVKSWLVKNSNLKNFLSVAQTHHFWGHGLDYVSNYEGWIGQYPWGRQFRTMEASCAQNDDFLREIDVKHEQTICGLGSAERMIAPSPQLHRIMGLHWSGNGTDFVDASGVLQVTQLDHKTGFDYKPCIVRRASLLAALERHNYAIVWGVVGERDCYSQKLSTHTVKKDAQISAVYTLNKNKIVGKVTKHLIQTIPRAA
jgi:hypothetical protein